MSGISYRLRHLTRYHYSSPALQSQNLGCLVPRSFPGQDLTEFSLSISPEPDWRMDWRDLYGNERCSFSFSSAHEQLEVLLEAKLLRSPLPELQDEVAWDEFRLPGGPLWRLEDVTAREFVHASPHLPLAKSKTWSADALFEPGRPIVELLDALTAEIHEEFSYDPDATETFTPLEEVYEKRAGVCQDFAHIAITELRRHGVPAGYVSGYLETLPPEGQEKLRGADASHAWFAVYVPGRGWHHWDPTNNCRVGSQHLISAWGRDYADVAPLKGVLIGGGEAALKVEVDVEREESPSIEAAP